MPRSGTTLIEQILAEPPERFRRGGNRRLDAAIRALRASDKIARIIPSSPRAFARPIASARRRYVRPHPRPAPRRRDHRQVAREFPLCSASSVWRCRRRRSSTCAAIRSTPAFLFSQIFEGGFPYAYDLGELGRYYRAYDALMAHWRAVLPAERDARGALRGRRRRLRGQARRIVAYCGLEWDARCLEFHEPDRPVHTASVAQVRQPIYATSIGRWRAYEPFLGPLRDALGPSATTKS